MLSIDITCSVEDNIVMVACCIVSPFGVAIGSFPGGTRQLTNSVEIAPLSDEHKSRIVDFMDQQSEEILSRKIRAKPAFVIRFHEIPFLKEKKKATAWPTVLY